MVSESNFDPVTLIGECRDLGNARFAVEEYAKAEEAFTLGLTLFELYGCELSQTAGYGCLIGLVDCLKVQSRDAEAEQLIRSSRKRLRKTA